MFFFRKRVNKKNDDPFVIQESLISGSSLGKDRNKRWVEENVKTEENNDLFSYPSEFIGIILSHRRLNVFLGIIFFAISILLIKTFYLQIIKGDYYRNVAEGNRIRVETVNARRGIIYDRNLVPLVRNIPTFSLYLVPGDLENEKKQEETINYLKNNISLEENDLRNKLETAEALYSPILIKENIDYDEALRFKIESSYIAGINLRLESHREYLNNNGKNFSLSHLLGYVGKISQEELEKNADYSPVDFIGKTGVESVYEKILRGKNGKKQIEVDALGKEKSVIAEEDPIDGQNIILTLDIELQNKLEEIVKNHLSLRNKKRAAAIVLNPQNGKVLALLSLPTFDNNLFAKGISSEDYQKLINDQNNPLFNRAIMGEYPSGSTIKPVISAAALEEKIIDKNTSFLSVGGIRIGSWFFPDWKAGGHGLTNVTKAIAESVNTFFYIIGGGYEEKEGLGVERIVKYLDSFGFGKKTEIDLPNESDGFLPSKEWKEKTKGERWYIGDTYHLAIGQGDILVTPLQIAAATSVFANKGTLFAPHLLEAIESPKPIDSEQYIVRSDFISYENINLVREGMRRTVTSGSAQKLLNLPVSSAGKTGTAQWDSKKDPHAWFTAFAPYEKPEIVVTVLVEEGREGSAISLDIAKDFLMWYFGKE
jgi:penicillin-binding protein 2